MFSFGELSSSGPAQSSPESVRPEIRMATLSRRTLVFSALGATAIAAAGGYLALSFERPAPDLVFLSPAELHLLEALCEVWFPAGVFPIDGIEAGVPRAVDEVVQEILEAVPRAGFRYVLRVLEWGTVARWGRRFTELTVDERIVVIDRWSDADVVPRRAAVDAVKAVLAIPYFRHPVIVEAIGWRTGCHGGDA